MNYRCGENLQFCFHKVDKIASRKFLQDIELWETQNVIFIKSPKFCPINKRMSMVFCYCVINSSSARIAATTGGGGGLESLIDIGPSSSGQVASEYIGVPATSSDPMLDDFLSGSSTKPAKKEEASLDDLEFWLSSDKPAAKVDNIQFVQLYYHVNT